MSPRSAYKLQPTADTGRLPLWRLDKTYTCEIAPPAATFEWTLERTGENNAKTWGKVASG